MYYVVAILGLAVLMVVHEAGHYLAARSAGLRVTRFSIGFGPTFFKVQPIDGFWWFTTAGERVKWKLRKHDPERHGPTVFQVALIPFLAYVQIAGMNPLEDIDPQDRGSYANARLRSRIFTIFAGPLANYLFASVFFFLPYYVEGRAVLSTHVDVVEGMPAAAAGLKAGDRIVEIDGRAVEWWESMAEEISKNPERSIPVVVEREGERLSFDIVPAQREGRGQIGVRPGPGMKQSVVPLSFGEAATLSLERPPQVVKFALSGMVELVRGKSDAKLGGPKLIVDEMKKAAELGWTEFFGILGSMSAYLAAFNLLPFPALDGGRLMFLGYEATTRKRANPTVEAHIHAIGLAMLLGLMIYVTFANDFGLAGSK
jgi:regulator of sigma E protease